MSSPSGLRPQDVVVLLKMAASKERSWRLIDLAQELGLSLSEVSMALERSRRARLLDSTKKKINWQAFSEFVDGTPHTLSFHEAVVIEDHLPAKDHLVVECLHE